MRLPFTIEQFLTVFREYNEAVWPAQWVLLVLAIAAIVFALRGRGADRRQVNAILALLWLWVAAAYHVAFFRTITAIAIPFAVAFAAQAVLFAWYAWRPGRLEYAPQTTVRAAVGAGLIAYALIGYPAVGTLFGHRYPDAPTFGVPCPTTIFTIGLLIWAGPTVPMRLVVIPVLWAIVGISAAVNLGMTEDLGLPVAAALLLGMSWRAAQRRRLATAPAAPSLGRRAPTG